MVLRLDAVLLFRCIFSVVVNSLNMGRVLKLFYDIAKRALIP